MKKGIFTALSVLLYSALLHAQTPGTLTVTTFTGPAGGNYAPRNIVAIWIEDDQGHFVKTLLAYAQTRKTHLNTWEASTTAAGSPFNVVDAITGATRPNHDTRSCTWNGTDVAGNLVADGTYHLWMELTDKNGTGNFSSFSFTKDTLPVNLNPLNVPSFSTISIDWEPVLTSVDDASSASSILIYPNPTAGIFYVQGERIIDLQIRSTSGKIIRDQKSRRIDISDQPDGIYLILIKTEKARISEQVVKFTK